MNAVKMKRFKLWPWFVPELLAPRISKSFNITRLCFTVRAMLNIIDLHSCLYHLVQTARFRAKDYLSRGVVLVWYKYEIHSPWQTACNDTKKVNLKNIENEINFRSMTKTRDKLSFFYSETSQFLYLVAFLVACAKLSDSRPRDVTKIKQTKRKKRRAWSPPVNGTVRLLY